MNRNLLLLLSLLSFVQISNAQFLWYENETNTYKIEKESTQFGTFLTDVLNPDITGINTNTTASQFNREEGENGFLYFDLFNPVIDFSGYSITIKAYLDLPTSSLTAANSKLRVYFQNSSTGGTPYKQLNFTLGQEWETFTFDFDGTDIPQEIIDAGGYNLVQIGFATGSQTLPAMTYYIDSIIGTTDQVVDDKCQIITLRHSDAGVDHIMANAPVAQIGFETILEKSQQIRGSSARIGRRQLIR